MLGIAFADAVHVRRSAQPQFSYYAPCDNLLLDVVFRLVWAGAVAVSLAPHKRDHPRIADDDGSP